LVVRSPDLFCNPQNLGDKKLAKTKLAVSGFDADPLNQMLADFSALKAANADLIEALRENSCGSAIEANK
jgi:hypothetical protein